MVLPKWTFPLAVLALVALTMVACAPQQRPGTFYEGQNNAINQQQRSNFYVSNQASDSYGNRLGQRPALDQAGRGQDDIGFIHYTNTDNGVGSDGADERSHTYVDRQVLANHIGSLVTANPQINDAMVLVTDDYVFVGINSPTEENVDAETIDEVRRTALSVTPRYYKVKVADDADMRQRIRNVGNKLSWYNGDIVDNQNELSDLLRDLGDHTPPRSSLE